MKLMDEPNAEGLEEYPRTVCCGSLAATTAADMNNVGWVVGLTDRNVYLDEYEIARVAEAAHDQPLCGCSGNQAMPLRVVSKD